MSKPPWVLCALLVPLALPALGQETVPQYILEFQKKGLPPVGELVEFEGDLAFPPKLKGVQAVDDPKVDFKPGLLPAAAEVVPKARAAALADAKVKAQLGERFALVTSGPVAPGKEQALGVAAPPRLVKLVFYSYSRNLAYTVLMTGDKVVSLTPRRKGHQPGTSREEVDVAAAILTRNAEHKAAVEGLRARGIDSPSPDGHRHLYLRFYKPKTTPPAFEAMVDMTAGRVLSARPIKHAEVMP